uniref:hypothetical protein n=1 Tax=Hymenobacter sp. B1770 TaxID=1718788 RepID=UPI003CF3CD18
VLAIGSLCSCDIAPDAKEVLAANEGQFWNMQFKPNERIQIAYRFLRDGTCIRYVVHKDTTVTLFDGGDVILSHEWSIANDTLLLDDIPFHIVSVAPDRLVLKHSSGKRTAALIKANKAYTRKQSTP